MQLPTAPSRGAHVFCAPVLMLRRHLLLPLLGMPIGWRHNSAPKSQSRRMDSRRRGPCRHSFVRIPASCCAALRDPRSVARRLSRLAQLLGRPCDDPQPPSPALLGGGPPSASPSRAGRAVPRPCARHPPCAVCWRALPPPSASLRASSYLLRGPSTLRASAWQAAIRRHLPRPSFRYRQTSCSTCSSLPSYHHRRRHRRRHHHPLGMLRNHRRA
mmetsp:Transcript_20994/g.58413  ORF Transcript_20994/g.58413 Transcript_20994/m.58413 type:complete len:215 (-) Transcript_20994:75-719(-)